MFHNISTCDPKVLRITFRMGSHGSAMSSLTTHRIFLAPAWHGVLFAIWPSTFGIEALAFQVDLACLEHRWKFSLSNYKIQMSRVVR